MRLSIVFISCLPPSPQGQPFSWKGIHSFTLLNTQKNRKMTEKAFFALLIFFLLASKMCLSFSDSFLVGRKSQAIHYGVNYYFCRRFFQSNFFPHFCLEFPTFLICFGRFPCKFQRFKLYILWWIFS